MRRNAWFILVLCIAISVHLSFLISLKFHFLNPLFHATVARRPDGSSPQGIDFFTYYMQGRMVLCGQDPYAISQQALSGQDVVPYHTGMFSYLPVFPFTVGVLLNLFQPWVSYWLWIALCECLLVLNIYATWRLSPSPRDFLVGALFWLCFFPYYPEYFLGQADFVQATLLFYMGYACCRGLYRRMDWFWVVTLLWKPFTVLYVPFFLKIRRYWTVIMALMLVVLINLPIRLIFSSWSGSSRMWQESFNIFSLRPRINVSNLGLQVFCYNIFHRLHLLGARVCEVAGREIFLYNVATALVIFGLLLFTIWITFLPKKPDPLMLLSLWTVQYFMLYQRVYEQHYLYLLPILVLLYLKDRSWFIIVVYILLAVPTPYALFIRGHAMPIFHISPPSLPAIQSIVFHASKIVPVFMLYCYLVRRLLIGGRSHDIRSRADKLEGEEYPMAEEIS